MACRRPTLSKRNIEISIVYKDLVQGPGPEQPNPMVTVFYCSGQHGWVAHTHTQLKGHVNHEYRCTFVFDSEVLVNKVRLDVFRLKDCTTGSNSGSVEFALSGLIVAPARKLWLDLCSHEGKKVGDIIVEASNVVVTSSSEEHSLHVTSRFTLCKIPGSKFSCFKMDPSLSCVFCELLERPVLLPTTSPSKISAIEQATESKMALHLPVILLNYYVDKYSYCVGVLQGLRKLCEPWQKQRQKALVYFEALIERYSCALRNLSQQQSRTFKSSRLKCSKDLEFLPTNLHVQRLHIYHRRGTGCAHDVLTLGAPAAHSLGFWDGGLRSLLHKASGVTCKVLHNLWLLHHMHADLTQKSKLLSKALEVQSDCCWERLMSLIDKQELTLPVDQSLTILVKRIDSYLLGKTEGMSQSNERSMEKCADSICRMMQKTADVVMSTADCLGFSLLQEPSQTLRRCLNLQLRRDVVFSQTLAAVVSGVVLRLHALISEPRMLQAMQSVGILVHFEGLLSTFRDERGMIEDLSVGVLDMCSVHFCFVAASRVAQAAFLPNVQEYGEGWIVEVPLLPNLHDQLPPEFRDKAKISLFPVFFNVGINEEQVLADWIGDTSLQQKINEEAYSRLVGYHSQLQHSLYNFSDQDEDIRALLSDLRHSVQDNRPQGPHILHIAAEVCRRLGGVRLTCCKSGKDRTAMAVTLEQVFLLQQHGLPAADVNPTLDHMRSQGCRIEIARKNVGRKKYAFNALQLKAFPRQYRPPDGTYTVLES
uniref:Phosphatidylinositol-3,4-bisphosphate 4-phosphatase n=1 Tax=Eptatretus burgeri TaxID=7764 RepID=A0A8C4R7E9_EPTBU